MLKYAVLVQSKVDPNVWIPHYTSRFILFCVIYMITHFKPSEWMSDSVIIHNTEDE